MAQKISHSVSYVRWLPSYLDAHLVFELVGVLVLFLVQVDEVVCDSFFDPGVHVPADLEGVTRDVADFDVLRHREFFHLGYPAVLGLVPCRREGHDISYQYVHILVHYNNTVGNNVQRLVQIITSSSESESLNTIIPFKFFRWLFSRVHPLY